jgi:hypothetical protein
MTAVLRVFLVYRHQPAAPVIDFLPKDERVLIGVDDLQIPRPIAFTASYIIPIPASAIRQVLPMSKAPLILGAR